MSQYVDAPMNGVDSARTAINDHIARLPANDSQLIIPGGTAKLSTRLIIGRQGLHLRGEDPYTTTLLLDGAAFQVGASDVTISDMTIKGVTNAKQLFQLVTTGAYKNWRFKNVRFDGVGIVIARLGATQPDGNPVTSGAALDEYVEFEDCEHLNYTEDGALYVRGTNYVSVYKGDFHNLGTDTAKGDALKFAYGAKYWSAIDNRFKDVMRDAIDCYDGSHGVISRNRMENVGVHAVECKADSPTATNRADRNRILDNTAINVGTGTPAPAFQCATGYVMMRGNYAETGTSNAYRFGKYNNAVDNGKGCTCVENYAFNFAGDAFLANGSDNLVMTDNYAEGNNRNYNIAAATNPGIATERNRSISGTQADIL